MIKIEDFRRFVVNIMVCFIVIIVFGLRIEFRGIEIRIERFR